MHRFTRPRTPSLSSLEVSEPEEEDEEEDDNESSSDESECGIRPWKTAAPKKLTTTTAANKFKLWGGEGGWLLQNTGWCWKRASWKVMRIYAMLVIVHYVCANLYSRLCTAQTFHGLLMSPFMVPAPHCEGLRWVVYHGAVRINGMWLLVGGQVVDFVTHLFV